MSLVQNSKRPRQLSGKKTTSVKKVKAPVLPILLEAAKYIEDPVWAERIKKMAYGSMVNGFMHRNGVIYCKARASAKNKGQLEIGDDPQQIAEELVTFLKKHSGMSSAIEEDYQEAPVVDISTLSWKEIKKNNILCKTLVSRFVAETVKSMRLNCTDKSNLEKIITVGLELGCFDNTIEIENGAIVSVEGLTYENGKFGIEEDLLLSAIEAKKKAVGKSRSSSRAKDDEKNSLWRNLLEPYLLLSHCEDTPCSSYSDS